MAHEAILTARGISESTWANIGWIPMTLGEFKRKHLNIANANETNDGWCLPIFLRLDDNKRPVYAYRWKSLHKSNDPRFLWSKQDKGELPFYFLPSHKVKEQRLALAEVVNTTKNLWIFSGESDYATAIEIFGQPVGVHVFGESRHSDEIFTLAKKLHAERVIFLPDKDDGGIKGADSLIAVYNAFDFGTETPIQLMIANYPVDIEGKDLNDLWIETNGMVTPESFKDDFTYNVIPHTPVQHVKQSSSSHQSTVRYDFAKLSADIESKLTADYGLKNSRCRCPMHDGKDANAVWNNDDPANLYCHSQCGGRSYTIFEVADRLNIHYKGNPYYLQDQSSKSLQSPVSRHSGDSSLSTNAVQPVKQAVQQVPVVVSGFTLITQDGIDNNSMYRAVMFPDERDSFYPFPFPQIKHLGGYAEDFAPGLMTLCIAPTGVGKTTTALNMVFHHLQHGDVLLFGPEFSDKLYHQSLASMASGVPYATILNNQKYLQTNGQQGAPLKQEQSDKIKQAIEKLVSKNKFLNWSTRMSAQTRLTSSEIVNYVKSHVSGVSTLGMQFLLDVIREVERRAEEGNNKPLLVIYDYIQLNPMFPRDKAGEECNATQNLIKQTLQLLSPLEVPVHWVTMSQATKSSYEAHGQGTARDGLMMPERTIQIDDGYRINANEANLAFTITPIIDTDTLERLPARVIYTGKNSKGNIDITYVAFNPVTGAYGQTYNPQTTYPYFDVETASVILKRKGR